MRNKKKPMITKDERTIGRKTIVTREEVVTNNNMPYIKKKILLPYFFYIRGLSFRVKEVPSKGCNDYRILV